MQTSAPFGLRAVGSQGGGTPTRQECGVIASGYATAIFSGDFVKLVTTGGLERAAIGDSGCGVFAGVEFVDASGFYRVLPYWPAAQTYTAGTCKAYYFRDPTQKYWIQANGALTAAAVGDAADLISLGGSTLSGQSSTMLSSTLVGAAATAQFKILGLALLPDNDWTDSFPVVEVMINEYAPFTPNTNTI